jgi:hypothetical protein
VELPGDQDLETPAPEVEDSATGFWTIATQLIQAGRLDHEKAGEISRGAGTWAEKAARLAVA